MPPAPFERDLQPPADSSPAPADLERLSDGHNDSDPIEPPAFECDREVAAVLAPEPGNADETIAPAGALSSEEPAFVPDLMALGRLCTEVGRVADADELRPLLQEAAGILGAAGLIVWVWDRAAEELRPALTYGYSDKVLAQLPAVKRDDDNATAAAFRLALTCEVEGSDGICGALVVPLLTPAGCAGVLALELQQGNEKTLSVRAVATILAAMLAQLTGGERPASVQSQPEVIAAAVGEVAPVLRVNVRADVHALGPRLELASSRERP